MAKEWALTTSEWLERWGKFIEPDNRYMSNKASEHQQDPEKNDLPCVQDMVIADLEARKRVGIERYGTTLQPHNGRDALYDLYQELLDACNYVRQCIYERDNPTT